ncbi:MAG TPA: hypothetical protein PLY23_00990 [Alphaproteobacteria bacterium]|nr:hypothetical protein [Alphaproteobacteria bacterium]HQS93225.1 hypothetical protein [Alphaproteobacteria bacterium]
MLSKKSKILMSLVIVATLLAGLNFALNASKGFDDVNNFDKDQDGKVFSRSGRMS